MSASISADRGLLEGSTGFSDSFSVLVSISASVSGSGSGSGSAMFVTISDFDSSSSEESSIVGEDSTSGSCTSSAESEPSLSDDPSSSPIGCTGSLSEGIEESGSTASSDSRASSFSESEDAIVSFPATSFATSAKATLGKNAKLKTKARVHAIMQSTIPRDRRSLLKKVLDRKKDTSPSSSIVAPFHLILSLPQND